MPHVSLQRMHQSQLEQLTGCRYATLLEMTVRVREHLSKSRGRPFKHSVLVMLTLSLMKLRTNLTVRSMEALTGVDAVTVARCVNRVMDALGLLPLAGKSAGLLIVDTTSTRIATTELKAYSGHKHHRCAKVQLIARSDGQIISTSVSHPGSVHDKTIWNKELANIKPLLDKLTLSDKAYAGATGEGEHLLRPIKRGETAYKDDKERAKEFNRGLSQIRVRVEHVFARLKNWRVLQGLFPFKWQKLGDVARALAVVHNLNRQFSGATR